MTLTSEEQHIYTPNYPQSYPNNAKCVWYIDVPEDSYTRFTISGKADAYDPLMLTYKNGSATETKSFWGRIYKKYFRSSVMKGTIIIKFDSGSGTSENGYDFSFKKLPNNFRGTNFNGSTGHTESYNRTELPFDDLYLFPSCRLSSIVDKFWKKCVQRKFLKSKKFKGPSQCISDCDSTKVLEGYCKNDTMTKIMRTFARGYRKQVWAKYHGDVFLNFPETIREALETIEYDCGSNRHFAREYGIFFAALSAQFERVLNLVTPNSWFYDYYY